MTGDHLDQTSIANRECSRLEVVEPDDGPELPNSSDGTSPDPALAGRLSGSVRDMPGMRSDLHRDMGLVK